MKAMIKKIVPTFVWEAFRQSFSYLRRLVLDVRATFEFMHPLQWLRIFFLIRFVRPAYSMVSPYRLKTLYNLSKRIHQEKISGAIVECGTYNGGSAAVLGVAQKDLSESRDMWLFDSFEGLPPPTENDGSYEREHHFYGWCKGGMEKVHEIFKRLHLPTDRLHIVAGWFQDTFPNNVPEIKQIALVHIDADWYESVKICLEYLYPKVAVGGYIAFDDYGFFSGCRKAVHEYLATHGIQAELKTYDGGVYFRKG